MHDLIFISLENWDDIWRRNQFVCAALARRHPQMKILFVGLSRNVSYGIKKLQFSTLFGKLSSRVPEFPNITLLHPLKLFPNSFSPTRHMNETMFRNAIRRSAAGLGMKKPVLWINAHFAVHLLGHLGESASIYDITDDWISFTQSPALTRLIERQDARLCRECDETIVCSQKLLELKQPLTSRLHLIPNGVDAEHYATVMDSSLPLPELSRSWKKPVFGYTGTIHNDRVDVALLDELASRFPKATFAMIGPNLLPEHMLRPLQAKGNIIFTGAVPYRDIPSFMRAFDVCMTPHRMTPFTESLNPIKLWEYLAAGKPIVSTNLAGFRDYSQHVRIARDADSFAAALQEAAAESLTDTGKSRALARQAEARRHSWDSRVDQIESVIQVCLFKGSKALLHAS